MFTGTTPIIRLIRTFHLVILPRSNATGGCQEPAGTNRVSLDICTPVEQSVALFPPQVGFSTGVDNSEGICGRFLWIPPPEAEIPG